MESWYTCPKNPRRKILSEHHIQLGKTFPIYIIEGFPKQQELQALKAKSLEAAPDVKAQTECPPWPLQLHIKRYLKLFIRANFPTAFLLFPPVVSNLRLEYNGRISLLCKCYRRRCHSEALLALCCCPGLS